MNKFSRRDFVRAAGLASALLPFARVPGFGASPAAGRKLYVFSKHLQWLDYHKMAEFVAECGYAGVDLTVRPGGHVEPKEARTKLPVAVRAMTAAGKEIKMMTTNILQADEPDAETVLRTAAEQGITHYRLGWYKYDPGLSIDANLQQVQRKMEGLLVLNEKFKIRGCYQNHAGMGVGSPVWDIARILSNLKSPWLGCQYDVRHAVVEGGNSWPLGYRYILPFINTLDLKDFRWEEREGKWVTVNVPMGEGMVDFDAFFALVSDLSTDIPACVHLEFDLGGAEHGHRDVSLPAADIMKAMRRERDFVGSRIAVL